MTTQPDAVRAFEGAMAIITGGASGIGKALAATVPRNTLSSRSRIRYGSRLRRLASG